MKIIKIVGVCLISLVICLALLVVLTDYAPDEVVEITVNNEQDNVLDASQPIRLGIFNIGFGGLDAGQDFFMDGGSGSRAPNRETVLANLKAVTDYLKETDNHIHLIQEVDLNSSRSFKINEEEIIGESLPDYAYSSAIYYKVPFVPLPLNKPLGKVEMEMLTLSKSKILKSTRYGLANIETLPDKYFYLDRCMLESVLPLSNGKNLVVLNVHLSAYDKNGTVKKQQLEWIEDYIARADLDSNYYVFGGDWNLLMTDTTDDDLSNWREFWVEKPKDFKDGGFQWAYDERVNTVRELDAPYKKGETFERVIDGYLVSPNIDILSVETVDLGFQNSDHNPVLLEIQLK